MRDHANDMTLKSLTGGVLGALVRALDGNALHTLAGRRWYSDEVCCRIVVKDWIVD